MRRKVGKEMMMFLREDEEEDDDDDPIDAKDDNSNDR